MGRGEIQPQGFLGWERGHIRQWLDDSRVTCITPQMLTELARNNRSMTVQLAPIQQFPFFDTKNRLAVIKINDNRAFVVEDWRPVGRTERCISPQAARLRRVELQTEPWCTSLTVQPAAIRLPNRRRDTHGAPQALCGEATKRDRAFRT